MPSYLLDTNHCIYIMNGFGKPSEQLSEEERNTLSSLSRLQEWELVYMSEVTIGEILYGIERSQRKQYNRLRFETLLSAVPPRRVQRSAWEIYGQVKGEMSMRGITIPDMDLLIAATAKSCDLILVANDKHMRNLPSSFPVENWAKG